MTSNLKYVFWVVVVITVVFVGALMFVPDPRKEDQLTRNLLTESPGFDAGVVVSPERRVEFSKQNVRGTFGCAADFDEKFLALDAVAARLEESENPEHLLVAAMYGYEAISEERPRALKKALNLDPDNRLILWNFLHVCSQRPGDPICRDQNIEARAIEVDGSNGQLWAKIAGIRFKRGDISAAFDALEKASAAPRFDEYSIEHIELFERGLAAAGGLSYRDRVIQAIGMESALVSEIGSVIEACEAQATDSADWLLHCLRLGERLERDGRHLVFIGSGIGLQQKMYSISGQEEKEAAVAERRGKIAELFRVGSSADSTVLLTRDDRVLADYLTEWRSYGGLQAQKFLAGEIERLKDVQGYDPCID